MPVQTDQILVAEDGDVRLAPVTLPPLASDEVLIETSKTLISPGTERALLLRLPGLTVDIRRHRATVMSAALSSWALA